ncbi:hypothetical protein SAMN05192560_2245 [Methylobacillus rhizosphaerae]|uniref:Uncharacterized protein n=1 Tax=Methylobacillus rhizosphaerae TaxID=551994 RepID=A0A239B253_9PROT|nr:hypothetical protein SAMN05192560_2245 [Methylobacillus rhizosphaerae]
MPRSISIHGPFSCTYTREHGEHKEYDEYQEDIEHRN